ncbi:MAG: carbohydrate ABC transporter permease [Candidatus Omnitrophota bacterium]
MNGVKARTSSFYLHLDRFTSFLFVFPAIIIFAVFYIYPFFETFNLALREWNGISLARPFVGLQNFMDLATDKIWWQSVWHAFFITLFALTIQNALAFMLAMACDREIRAKNFYRVVFFIPPVLSEVVVGLVWKWILDGRMQGGQYFGLLNHFLDAVGLDALVNNWLSDPQTALTCIAVVHSWKGFGWGFIMFLAGLQTIDRQLYEAARVDGAGAWRTFWNVTVPMMLPVIVVVVILTILGSMQAFVLVLSMTNGGPGYHTEVPVTRILAAMTGTKEYGLACAMGVTFGAILIVMSGTLKKIEGKIKGS